MKTKIFTIVILLLSFSIVSCNDSVEPEDPVKGEPQIQVYNNQSLKFKISVPANWEYAENVQIGDYEAILKGIKVDYTNYQAGFNIVAQDVPMVMDPAMLISASEQNLPNMFSGVEFDSKNLIEVNGFNCAEIVFRYKDGSKNMKLKQLLFMCNSSTLIVITFDTIVEQFENDKIEFELMQNSLEKI